MSDRLHEVVKRTYEAKKDQSHDIFADEYYKVGLATLVPMGLVAGGWYIFSNKKDQLSWFQNLKKPSWALSDSKAMVIDFLCNTPVGCAAYLAHKHARPSDTKAVMGLCGVGLTALAISMPIYTNTKNLKWWTASSAVMAAISGAMAVVFYKIHDHAGMMMIPLAAWSLYTTAQTAAMIPLNSPSGPKF